MKRSDYNDLPALLQSALALLAKKGLTNINTNHCYNKVGPQVGPST